MKKIIIFPLLMSYLFIFSQKRDFSISYDLQDTILKIVDDTDTSNLILPLKLKFTEKFIGKSVSFIDINKKQTIALNNAKFGDGYLTKDLDSGKYIISIDKDGIVNPGGDKINDNQFILQIDQIQNILSIKDNTGEYFEQSVNQEEVYEPGYIYYDVMKLIDPVTSPEIKKKVLKFYRLSSENIKENPYLADLPKINDFIESKESEAQGGEIPVSSSFLGNLDVTYFAAGLAKFLAVRVKEELNEAFFSKMKEQINSYPELKKIFPKTASFLDIIETYSFNSVIQVLKEVFENDVQNLPQNLYNIKDLSQVDCDKILIWNKDMKKGKKGYTDCQERLKALADFFATQEGNWLVLGLFSVKEGIKASDPAHLLNTIVTSPEFSNLQDRSESNDKFDDYNLSSVIALNNFISQSLISKGGGQLWVSSSELNLLFKKDKALKVYIGLLLASEIQKKEENRIYFYKSGGGKFYLKNYLHDGYSKLVETESIIRSLIEDSYSAYNAANNAIRNLIYSSSKSIEANPQVLYDYYKCFTSSLRKVAYNPILKSIIGKDITKDYDKIDQLFGLSVDICYHISLKKYDSAIYDAIMLLNILNKKTENENIVNIFEEITKPILKYGTLISTIAAAQSAEEVNQALDASLLPVGSYSIKRKTNWSISINSYVGAFWDYTRVGGREDYLPDLGLAAPVGVNFSKGFSKKVDYGSISMNLQVFDIGALVNFYLINGSDASIPNDFKVRLSNIFSPGINLCYNIPKIPISLAWGGQYIPALYSYEQINGINEFEFTSAWRWQFSFLVDIPFYNLKIWDFN